MQLGLATETQKVSLPVKRRLACEQLSYFAQVSILIPALSPCMTQRWTDQNISFLCFVFHMYFEFASVFYDQAHYCLSGCDMTHGCGKKHLTFIKWKYLEAKVKHIPIRIFFSLSSNSSKNWRLPILKCTGSGILLSRSDPWQGHWAIQSY